MSEYHKDLIKNLSNSVLWPDFKRPDFIQILDTAASEAFNKQTLEGYLAAFLIYQQISEDMVKNIVNLGRLFNMASVFPLELKYQPLDSSKMTFGALLKQLDTIPHADSTLSDLCKQLNTLRIQLVHKITSKESLGGIKDTCQEALTIYEKIEESYLNLDDWFRLGLKDYKKDALEDWKTEYSELLE